MNDANPIEPRPRKRRTAEWFVGIALVLGAIVLNIRYAQLVMQSATSVAGGAPFCITFPTLDRQARGWSELTFLLLPRGDWRPHALTLVDRENGTFDAYHWSFRSRQFVLDGRLTNDHLRGCRPRRDYARALPIWPTAENDVLEVYFAGRFFEVPSAYDPQHSQDQLALRAVGPDFAPLGTQAAPFVTVQPAKGGFPFPESANGTIARCLGPKICSYEFAHEGLLFAFSFPRRELPRLKEMQAKLIQKFHSFEVGRKAPIYTD